MKRYTWPDLNAVFPALFCCFVLLCFTPRLNAQSGIGFYQNAPPVLQDTSYLYGDTMRYTFQLQNLSSQSLTGTVFLNIQVFDSAQTLVFSGIVDTLLVAGTLNTGDTTAQFTSEIPVSPARFAQGGGVVVIWPSKPGYSTTDSLSYDIWVGGYPISVQKDMDADPVLFVYPNPVVESFYFENRRSGNMIPEGSPCLLLDVQGRVVRRYFYYPGIRYSVEDLPAGVYRFVIQGSDEIGVSLLKSE